ncbi:MAG: type II toxin-antitoxin system PemK/MazF family toxin [Acidibacillus sp.]|nr:type II toxin-antitoxin system PemK/MazF family toxin [Sulfoacidibacillus ferrooxidans]MCY0892273.1 type II toxin-antitoxin system PemK/MazF family toxin [Acidibacillus sp.]
MNFTQRKPKQGQIYLMAVEYRDRPNIKKARPVVVVSNERATDIDVIAVSVSSQLKRSEYDVSINYWKECGLSRPSIARTSKLISVSIEQLQTYLGELDASDLKRIIEKCRDVF